MLLPYSWLSFHERVLAWILIAFNVVLFAIDFVALWSIYGNNTIAVLIATIVIGMIWYWTTGE